MQEVLVSVICNAYNHGKYIQESLDGIVMQKTNFKFEVLVHDDASTDNTADIIREYEKRYPDLIKPIYQTENQYSQGISIFLTYQFPRVQGKYFAICEGDDYWVDEYKLQKQYDALERHPELDICAHGAFWISGEKTEFEQTPASEDKIFSPEEVIAGGGDFVATASLMCRTSLNDDVPPFRKIILMDYTLQIQGSLRGGMIYLKDIMSAYRFLTPGSWTQRIRSNLTKQIEHRQRILSMFKQLDVDTNFQYHDLIEKEILWVEQRIYRTGFDICCNELFSNKYRQIYKSFSFREKVEFKFGINFPGVLVLIRKLRGRKNH